MAVFTKLQTAQIPFFRHEADRDKNERNPFFVREGRTANSAYVGEGMEQMCLK